MTSPSHPSLLNFAAEQRALAATCWQLVGLRDALEISNSWIRCTVFGVDTFVQSFDGELRGFHNVCAHRGFPLRRDPAGVGPVQCGFHGWAYNRDGIPTSVPRNAELFGLSREQRVALALPELRVATIGRFVFASVATIGPSLEQFLGPYADVFRAVSARLGAVVHSESIVLRANWKLFAEITLDDYHLGTVHPTSFGAGEPAPLYQFVYRRDGLHSCYLKRRDADWSFEAFWTAVRVGDMDPTGYKIFNCMPGFLLAATRDACVVTSVTALASDRTVVHSQVFVWRDPAPDADACRAIAHYWASLFREDRETCERWQGGNQSYSVLGRLEERIAWFRDAYADVILRGGGGYQ